MSYKPIPIGVDDFEKIIEKGYYYVDKTNMIKDLIDKGGDTNLFTRPRRFGKTLNLSMIKYFFEKPIDGKSNKHLFEGLNIMDAGDKYTSLQEQYPVITLTLKSAKQPSYELAYGCLIDDIAGEYTRHSYVLESDEIIDEDKEKFKEIRGRRANEEDYAKAIAFLSNCLYKYHQKKVIILIDEYDVPLENAYYTGFYDQMVSFIRSLFESALKTNPYLEFGVITGCLRISKESIFTGLNNLKINSILTEDYDEYFGFTEDEVMDMLSFYDREKRMDTMRSWYDGYKFGVTDVYNPWSVINFVSALLPNENAFPTAAWSNTSSNQIVKDLIERADGKVREEIQRLMNGGTIEKKIHEDITYEDVYESEDNLWNFLFFTGYLKNVSIRMENNERYITMAIPNIEVKTIYSDKISTWFRDDIKVQDLSVMYEAMLKGDAETFEKEVAKQLRRTISYMDSKEAFYHGFMAGLMSNLSEYVVKSNREAGDGRYDICVYNYDETIPPVIMEFKVAEKYKLLDEACDTALTQIKDKRYTSEFAEDGYTEAILYGVGFFRKRVMIKVERIEIEEDEC